MPLDLSTLGTSRPSKGLSLEGLGSAALETSLNALSIPLEILSRPSYAISEGAGATKAGGGPLDILGASWRGFSGGDRRYPSLGETVLGEEAPWLAKTAVDLVGDPLMFVPGAKLSRLAISSLKGTRLPVGMAARMGVKTVGEAARVGAINLGKSLSRSKFMKLVLPLESQLSLSGKYGKAVALKSRRASLFHAAETSRKERGIIQEMNRLGLDKPEDAPKRILAARHRAFGGLRAGKSTGDSAVDEFARFLGREFDTTADDIERKFPDIFPEFSQRRIRDYFPQMIRGDIMDALERGDIKAVQALAPNVPVRVIRNLQPSPSGAAGNLAKMLGISDEEAEALWRYNTGRPMKAGNIELPRLTTIPDEFLDWDPAKVYPRYYNQLNRRLAYALEFGKDFEGLEKLLRKTGLSEDIIGDARQAIRDPVAPEGNILSKDFARKLLGAMVVTKMGVTSTVANFSQSINTGIVDGGANFVRGVFRARNPTARAQAVVAYHFNLKQTLEHVAGDVTKPLIDVKGLRWLTPDRYLSGVGFSQTETLNRILAATSGVTTAERLAMKAVKTGRTLPTRELVKRGIKREEFNYFRQFEKFSEEGTEMIGLRAANRTQHVTSYLDIPLAWRSPEMRLMTQYKSFIYQQSRFIAREVLTPAAKYFAGSPEGDLKPLLRASVAFGIGGQAVAGIRALIRGDDKRKFDSRHPLQQLLRDASYVGAFGMASDIVDSALRGKIGDYFWGPSIEEAFDTVSGIARFVNEPELPSVEEAGEAIYNKIGRGPLPMLGRFFEK